MDLKMELIIRLSETLGVQLKEKIDTSELFVEIIFVEFELETLFPVG